MGIRTDLALEKIGRDIHGAKGIKCTERGDFFRITDIIVESDADGRLIGKPKGRYLTLETSAISRFSDNFREMTMELSRELSSFIRTDGSILVAGIGNSAITPDALGPRCASKILATRHLKSELEEGEADFLRDMRPVSVLQSGVLGQSGMETAEVISAVCEKIKPSAVIVIDALACADLSRLGTTIQMCDSGICPGSGVDNRRHEISQRSIGVPVTAVGVPTVVDLHTVARDITGQDAAPDSPNMMVTPRDIDRLIDHAADMISCAVNLSLHRELTFEDAVSL